MCKEVCSSGAVQVHIPICHVSEQNCSAKNLATLFFGLGGMMK
jgi:hypothetical protein